MIIWLLGISGSGKTTLGTLLKKRLDAKKVNSFLMDGDTTRDFFDNDLGYSKEDRIQNIKRILFAAYALNQKNIVTIVCNIFPFQELRDFARAKISDYNEIYLHKNLNRSLQNDIKNVYRDNMGKTELVGIDIPFDEPIRCDLKVDVDSLTVEGSLEKINMFLKKKYPFWAL